MAHTELILYRNAKITTLDPANPEAKVIVTAGDRIVFVGREADATPYAHARIVDLKGQRVLPGFIEAHGHFIGTGFAKLKLDLRGTTSIAQIADRVRTQAASVPQGAFIVGRGWDQNLWGLKNFPTHEALSDVAPHNPVVLTRIDGHALWCNECALVLAGIDDDSKDPPGGHIVRDAKGHATGVFIDTAMDLILKKIPKPSDEEALQAAQIAQEEALSLGITSFHDAGSNEQALRIFERLGNDNRLKVRLYAMLDGDDDALLARYIQMGPKHDLFKHHLSIRAIKLYADGALGSRGAALLAPYSDEPSNSGLVLANAERVERVAALALANGFQVATHAIGDRANRFVLDAYERAQGDTGSLEQARFRIEHAQIVNPDDIPRFAKLHVIASMQPTHCNSDAPWVPARLGDTRARMSAYVWRSLLNAKAKLAFGSDAPIEALNPSLGLYASVERAIYPEQALTLHEALHAFTVGGAYAEFAEQQKGMIAKDYLADFIVLDKDILTLPHDALLSAKVVMTVVGGEKVYEAKKPPLKPLSLLKRGARFMWGHQRLTADLMRERR